MGLKSHRWFVYVLCTSFVTFRLLVKLQQKAKTKTYTSRQRFPTSTSTNVHPQAAATSTKPHEKSTSPSIRYASSMMRHTAVPPRSLCACLVVNWSRVPVRYPQHPSQRLAPLRARNLNHTAETTRERNQPTSKKNKRTNERLLEHIPVPVVQNNQMCAKKLGKGTR